MTNEDDWTGSRAQLRDALIDLGFGHYEAKCYVGLLGSNGLTGYGVAKATNVPQPKVYETLRRLVRRGAAQQIGEEPAMFVATPPNDLLDLLEREFRERHDLAATVATTINVDDVAGTSIAVRSFSNAEQVLAAARELLQSAKRRVYVSLSARELQELMPDLRTAAARGVDIVLLHFGAEALEEEGMQTFRHASTDRSIYRHHQARHVALVSDSKSAMTAVAVDGEKWEGVQSTHTAIIAAVKGMIRHDIDLQQVYMDFHPALVAAYGPGLQALESYRAPVERHDAEEQDERRKLA